MWTQDYCLLFLHSSVFVLRNMCTSRKSFDMWWMFTEASRPTAYPNILVGLPFVELFFSCYIWLMKECQNILTAMLGTNYWPVQCTGHWPLQWKSFRLQSGGKIPDQSVDKWHLLKKVPSNWRHGDQPGSAAGGEPHWRRDGGAGSFGEEKEGGGIHNCYLPPPDLKVCIVGRRWRKKSEADVKTGAGKTGRVEGKLTWRPHIFWWYPDIKLASMYL